MVDYNPPDLPMLPASRLDRRTPVADLQHVRLEIEFMRVQSPANLIH